MGIVYEAEQQSPRRRVALKVVRGGHFVHREARPGADPGPREVARAGY